ncbi:MAG: hypothetical protein ACK5PZ_08660, partial [Pirellula sp.]
MSKQLPVLSPADPIAAGECSSVGANASGNIVSRYLDNLGERQPHGPLAKAPLPMSMEEARARGW